MHPKHKEHLRAAALMNVLDNFATMTPPDEGPGCMPGDDAYDRQMRLYLKAQRTPAQINAIQIILKKLVPDLSAVEQTVVDDRDSLTEAQIFEQLKAMVSASPELARQLREMLTPTAVPAAAVTPIKEKQA